MAILEVEHINKKFDRTEVLKDISFSLEQGQVLSIIGSSGSGKTTLLRCLNFLERPTEGEVLVGGKDLSTLTEPSSSTFKPLLFKVVLYFDAILENSSFNRSFPSKILLLSLSVTLTRPL